uniref:H(+)-exporting diphosphatase n=2 Tax=Alexandrium monilatum TaxID=311494 RepID=A0A7S4R3G9_9DINO
MVAFGVVLALCAGVVDAVGPSSLAVFVSHVTGTVARAGMRIEGVTTGMNENWDIFHCMMLVTSFIFGSFVCGLLIPKNQDLGDVDDLLEQSCRVVRDVEVTIVQLCSRRDDEAVGRARTL